MSVDRPVHHRFGRAQTGGSVYDDEEPPDTVTVVEALGSFDPRWLPVGLRSDPDVRPGRDASGTPTTARRLTELLESYRQERGRIRREARRLLGVDGPAADDLVLRAVRRLCQAPPPMRFGAMTVFRAALRAEALEIGSDGDDTGERSPPAPTGRTARGSE